MAEKDDVTLDENDVPEIEFIDLPPGQEEPSPDEEPSAEDQSSPSSSSPSPEGATSSESVSSLSEGFKELAQALKTQVPAQQPVQQQPKETDEEFAERLKEQLFSENPLPALQEAIQRFTQPAVGQALSTTMELAKKVMELDPEKAPVYKKYKSEIEGFVKGLPPNVQMNPQVYDYAYKEIYSRHINEIMDEKIKQKEEEIRKQYEQKQKQEVGGKTVFMEGTPTTRKAPKKRVYVTAAEKEEAARRGLPLEEYLRIKGKL